MNWQKAWCVAKPSSDEPSLMANLNYTCSQVDCGVLRKGCPCFYPNNLMNHASVAMNLYYQAKGRNKWNCNFRNSGLIVVTDPSEYSPFVVPVLQLWTSNRFLVFFVAGYNNCVYA